MAPPRRPPSKRPSRTSSASGPSVGNADAAVLDWLLEESQPAVRYRTLTELLGRGPDNPEVRAARSQIPRTGWAAEILAARGPGGAWPPEEKFYWPKYRSTNWQLLILSDLGITKKDPRVASIAERWMEAFHRPDGGFWASGKHGHLCTTGNTVRALIRFGYEEDPRVVAGLEWMVRNQAKLGGWSCFGSGRNLDSWEPMSAFAAYPRSKWTPEIEGAVQRGAEFFLSRELHRQGAPYAPWDRFHYPVHYYYDLLVGLDFLTTLGFGADPRLGYALGVLQARRRSDGRWNLDAIHPDVAGAIADWLKAHPRYRPTPVALETVGAPSKMITLTALKVLRGVDRATGTQRLAE